MPAKIKRGDKVVVLAGKDRGKQGTVRALITKDNRVLVEGVNIIKRHQRARQQGRLRRSSNGKPRSTSVT